MLPNNLAILNDTDNHITTFAVIHKFLVNLVSTFSFHDLCQIILDHPYPYEISDHCFINRMVGDLESKANYTKTQQRRHTDINGQFVGHASAREPRESQQQPGNGDNSEFDSVQVSRDLRSKQQLITGLQEHQAHYLCHLLQQGHIRKSKVSNFKKL